VLPGWPAKMTWFTFMSTELRDCRLRHVPQFNRWTTSVCRLQPTQIDPDERTFQ